MIRAALPYLLTAIAAVILRDLECFVAAKIFCWRKRRQSQREAKQNMELRKLAAEFAAKERAEEVKKQEERTARLMKAVKVPFPELLGGPLIVTARTSDEVYAYCRQVSSNIAAQQRVNCFSESDFGNN